MEALKHYNQIILQMHKFNEYLCEHNIHIKKMQKLRLELAYMTFTSIPVPYPSDWSIREHWQTSEV
jgi:hypothetical protein